jgi:phage shock protein PspC (stress-responsive transcriptional regulator)
MDIVFAALTIGMFALLVLAVYLILALLFPERF